MDRESLAADTAKTAAALRSQLNQMAAASQVLERSTAGEKERTYLAVINQSICRMLRIVGRMELGHRLTDEAAQLSLRYIDLTLQLEDLSSRLQGVLADIGVTFTLHSPDHLYAVADGDLLRQMLLELISNLALVSTAITLSVTVKDDRIHFSLRDNGPGQADGRPRLPAQLEEQEEQSSLDLARKIAELHGGTLMISASEDDSLSIAVSIPHKKDSGLRLESSAAAWYTGGFDPVLVAMSQLLPSRSFLPDNLG